MNMRLIKEVRFVCFTATVTLLYGLLFTLSEFIGSPIRDFSDFMTLSFQWSAITFATFGLICLIALGRVVFAMAFPVLTLLSTLLAYFRYTANVTLTPMVIDLAFVNDFRTNMEVVSWQLILCLVIGLLFSVLVVRYRWRHVDTAYGWVYAVVAIGIIFITNELIPALRRPLSERMPYSIYYNLARYYDERAIVAEDRNTFVQPAVATCDTLTVVMVIGESLRADHLQLNGYHRETTPYLSHEKNVVSLKNVYTEPCFTHVSVPHMLTRADSLHPERAYEEQSFVSVFKKAGFGTAWIANQESVDTYVYFMNECDTLIYANSGKSMYVFDEWLDGDLLPHLRRELRDMPQLKLVILHTIGSHWWYDAHYTDDFKKFVPTIKSRVISSNTREEMINSYDNTVLYTDYIMKAIIDEIREENSILFFLSDHGECLGEDGFYTHGSDRPELHYPAAFVWYSDEYAMKNADKILNLRQNAARCYRSDYLFHSILDAAGVNTPYMDESYSIFKTYGNE